MSRNQSREFVERFNPKRDDDNTFGDDDQAMPMIPGHFATGEAGESPQAAEERAKNFGMDLPQDDNPDTGFQEFDLEAADDLKREYESDKPDTRR